MSEPVIGHVDILSRSRIEGWAAFPGNLSDTVALQIIVNGELAATIAADRPRESLKSLLSGSKCEYGFRYDFPTSLPQWRTHVVEVRPKGDFGILPNGRAVLVGDRRGPLQPVIVTSTGRAGTTFLMEQLCQHGEFAIVDSYPYEVQMVSYYAAALHVLTNPQFNSSREYGFAVHSFRDIRIGPNPWNIPALSRTAGGEYLAQTFSQSVPNRFAATFRELILEYYEAVSNYKYEGAARFFVEKLFIHREMRWFAKLIFPEMREVVVIRDPRDYFCSAKRFWQIPSSEVIRRMQNELPVVKEIREAGEPVRVLRYEDLIQHPEKALSEFSEFVGCADFRRLDSGRTTFARHATSKGPNESIGRWRTELTADELSICEKKFGWLIDAFGY